MAELPITLGQMPTLSKFDITGNEYLYVESPSGKYGKVAIKDLMYFQTDFHVSYGIPLALSANNGSSQYIVRPSSYINPGSKQWVGTYPLYVKAGQKLYVEGAKLYVVSTYWKDTLDDSTKNEAKFGFSIGVSGNSMDITGTGKVLAYDNQRDKYLLYDNSAGTSDRLVYVVFYIKNDTTRTMLAPHWFNLTAHLRATKS